MEAQQHRSSGHDVQIAGACLARGREQRVDPGGLLGSSPAAVRAGIAGTVGVETIGDRPAAGFTTAARSRGSEAFSSADGGGFDSFGRRNAGIDLREGARTAGIDLRDAGRAPALPCAGGGGVDALRMSTKRAWTRPSRMTACTPMDPTPSSLVVHAAGFDSRSSTYRLPPTETSMSRMASVEGALSSTGSYFPPTLMHGRRSLATANSPTSALASSRSIC